ncbi:histidine phosphatase family protein [Candidatus Woesearchaeota archaeon]|nr:histidine phosphatase family protein [Candidatus Woesearchaeota archaeon]
MKLFLVRHGQTSWNKEKRYQGKTDIPLSSLGSWQAARIAKRLQREHIRKIYSSTLKRALSTAAPIAKFHKLPVDRCEELCERDYGDWEGLPKSLVIKKFPKDFVRYEKNRYFRRPTRGESLLDLERKLTPFARKILAKSDAGGKGARGFAVVIVAHNGTLRALYRYLADAPAKKVGGLAFKEASVTCLTIKGRKVKIISFNSISHLKDHAPVRHKVNGRNKHKMKSYGKN